MKKMLMTLAAVFCCTMFAAVVCTSCTSDETANIYSMGFDPFYTTDPSTLKDETTLIETTFQNAIQQNLGVTITKSQFKYDGGADKVKAVCEKAAAELATKTFTGHYVYSLTNKSTTVYRWSNY